MEPHKPPFLKCYDPNSRCDYHFGAQGHSTENCLPLKYNVQSLIKVGWLDFNRNNGPSVMANPLPNHTGPNVNTVMVESDVRTKARLDEVKSPMDVVYKAMVKMGVIPKVKIFEGK